MMPLSEQVTGNFGESGNTVFMIQERLQVWYELATRGTAVIYATGNIAYDRGTRRDKAGLLNATADYALALHKAQRVQLSQRRIGNACYEYLITKK